MSAQAVDLIIVGCILAATLGGVWLGALRAVSGLLCTAVVVALMLLGYAPLARLLEPLLGIGPRPTTLVAFALLALAGQLLAVLTVQRPLFGFRHFLHRRRGLRRLDRLLGAVPGALGGCIVAGLLLAPLAVAAPDRKLGATLREAPLASRLLEADARILQAARVRPLLQTAADTLALPATLAENEGGRDLAFRVAAGTVAPDPEAEAQLLALVNEERARAGLPALAFDAALVPVGRAHGTEMFEQGYFAHESPLTGHPFDRLAAAEIVYLTAGENLAFAPDLLTAHRGLMNSPGHRVNILSAEFGRVGMAVLRSRYHGLMVVQMFRD